MRKMTLIELNEFNLDLLKSMSAAHDFKNIKAILNMRKSTTFTEDSEDNDTLDPWVQWVSIHTGVPYQKHQVKRLGDIPNLEVSLMWEKLSDMGITSGVWGALNAERKGENCKYFLPDPWTYSEPGFPRELQRLVAFPRYMAKNRVGYSIRKILGHIGGFLGIMACYPKATLKVFMELPRIIYATLVYRAPFALYLPAEYFMTLLFCEYRKKYPTDFSLIFLNGIAHLQHYYWETPSGTENYPLKYGFRFIDKMLGEILNPIDTQESVLITNGFSQTCTISDSEWRAYRPTNHDVFLKKMGINFIEVEELMTADAHILFASTHDAREAIRKLSDMSIGGEPVFFIESNQKEEKKIFYKVRLSEPVHEEAVFMAGGNSYRFYDYFSNLGSRTGKHCAKGDIFYSNLNIPEIIPNHEIYDLVINHQRPPLEKQA